MAKTPRTPTSPLREAEDQLKRWARTTDFPQPLPWAELEAHLVALPTPSHQELEPIFPPATRRRLLPLLIVAPLALVTVGSSLVALGFVVAHVVAGVSSSDVGQIAQVAVLASIIITVVPVAMWVSTRRRGGLQLLSSAGTAGVSTVSFVLLGLEDQVGVWSTIRVMTALAVAGGLATTLFLLVLARPGPSRTWSERLARPTLEDLWLRGQRALVLEVLVKRGLVSRWDVSDLMELPRDTWKQLETRPDGHVVRHHR